MDTIAARNIARAAATVVTVHDTTPFNGDATSSLQVLHSAECWRRFHHAITHTESGRRSLIARGLQPQRVSTLPHGLLRAARSDARSPGTTTGPLRILFFGQIKPYKGLDTLIDALTLMPAEAHRRVKLHVRGQAFMDMSPLLAKVAAAGLAEVVDFRLERIPDDEVDSLFAEADVVAMPYHRIDASGVLSKALAHGVAVLATQTGGFAEVLRHGETALLCQVGDSQAFARAIMDLATDPALLARLWENASHLGETTASWPEIGRRTVDLYQQVLARCSRTVDPRTSAPTPIAKPR